jgi:hypothetical protein
LKRAEKYGNGPSLFGPVNEDKLPHIHVSLELKQKKKETQNYFLHKTLLAVAILKIMITACH